jgi:AbrB family looped-hinge helix DNA binding protein
MTQTTLTMKGQVTIPKEIRDGLHLKEGDKVAFVFDGDRALLFPMKSHLAELRGILKGASSNKPFDPPLFRQKAKKHVIERWMGRHKDK